MAMRKKDQTVYLVCVSNSHIIQFSNSSFIKPAIETIPLDPKGTISIKALKGLMKELSNSQLVDKSSHLSDAHI